jgi:hypothetical protein
MYYYLWHLILKISSSIYLVKFHFRRLKCKTLMFFSSYPRRSGVRHVLSQQEINFLNHPVLLPSITKVMGSLVTFGCCALKKPALEFVGVFLEPRREVPKRQICRITYPRSSILLMSFRSCSLPTPVSYICYSGKTLFRLFNILFTSPWTVNK